MANSQTKNEINMILTSPTSHNSNKNNNNNSNNFQYQHKDSIDFIKSSFLNNNSLETKIQWIWSNNESTDSKVSQLFNICNERLNSLYDCEMVFGPNNPACSEKLNSFNKCLSKNICPKEYYLTELFCFGKTNHINDQTNIKIPPSALNEINQDEKNHLCTEYSNALNKCFKASISKIWE